MKISYNWLKEYVNIKLSPAELAEKLTSAGVVVEHVTSPFGEIKGVVVAEIKEIAKHPDADKLSVTKVYDGQETYQVVCGAGNIKVGQRVPMAQVGAVLPGDFKIKKSKIRGVESFGMLCSADELALDLDVEDGILLLPSDTQLGLDISEVLDLNDNILLLDLTPNRSDCLSLIGLAEEVSALTGEKVAYPQVYTQDQGKSSFNIEIKTDDCKNYIGQELSNITVDKSPLWIQIRLLKAGIRPINNVVDITNYVMLEYGQPLHGFDAEKIISKNIVVKNIEESMEFVTLDSQKRQLKKGILSITDGTNPLAIAGVMGGEQSEVDENTTNILVESAYFNNIAVRKSVKNLNLRTEASARFEKKVAPLFVEAASLRATKLMTEICGAKVVGITKVGDFTHEPTVVNLCVNKVSSLLGIEIKAEAIKGILSSLGCKISGDELKLVVEIPHHRVDISIDVDLIEEVARIYGYDNIPATLPTGTTTAGSTSLKNNLINAIRDLLIGQGISEVVSYPFISPESFLKTKLDYNLAIPLANPLGRENSLMRTSLVPSVLQNVSYNINHQIDHVSFFEVGRIYLGQLPLLKLPQEQDILALAILGENLPQHWATGKGRKNDFYTLKGVLENILSLANIDNWTIVKEDNNLYHPGRSGAIYIGQEKAGYLGQIHPQITKNWDIKEEVYILEIELDKLVDFYNKTINYKSVIKYPAVKRDLAFVVDKGLEVGLLINEIKQTTSLVTKADAFDIYTGKGIDEDKKSVAISITLQKAGTLKEEEINFFVNKILTSLEVKFNAKLR